MNDRLITGAYEYCEHVHPCGLPFEPVATTKATRIRGYPIDQRPIHPHSIIRNPLYGLTTDIDPRHCSGCGRTLAGLEFGSCDRGREVDGAGPHRARDDAVAGDAAYRHDVRGHRLLLEVLAYHLLFFSPGISHQRASCSGRDDSDRCSGTGPAATDQARGRWQRARI